MYSFGIMLFKACFPNLEPVLLPGKDSVAIPEHENSDLRDLLANLLKRDPSSRITASDAASHIYFTSFLVKELESKGFIVDSDKKIAALNSFLFHMKRANA